MTKAPIALQELRRRIYRKAKSEKAHRFWGIFVHVTRTETLEEAYRIAKRNGGAAGIDGQTFATIETAGLECFLADIKDDLETGRYKPHPNRRVDIPKEQGKFRTTASTQPWPAGSTTSGSAIPVVPSAKCATIWR